MALADAVCADARANVMRGHRTVGTGRIQISVEGSTLEVALAQWKSAPTAVLAEAEAFELREKLDSALKVLKAANALAAAAAAKAEEDFSDLA